MKGTVKGADLILKRGFMLSAAAALLFVSGCAKEQAANRSATPVRVGSVVAFDQSNGLRYSANIIALTQVNLAFKSGGYVDSILMRRGADGRTRVLQVGDRVSQGEILAHVRDSDYVDHVNSAQAQVGQAQANYDKARLDFERADNLYRSESVTKSEYDSAKAAFDSGTGAVDAAKASLQQARTALADCSVRSPLTGWVLERDVEIGSLVGTGTQAFVLADTHLVKASFGVPDTRVNQVKLGAMQTITTTSFPGEFRGRITAVSPSADPKSRVFSVEVTIPNPDDRLKPGMIASLTLGGGGLEPIAATVVPLSAVVRSTQQPNGFAVFVVSAQNGKSVVHERSVEIGDTLGNMISVTKGVKAGESIVITGATLVKEGEEIKVIP